MTDLPHISSVSSSMEIILSVSELNSAIKSLIEVPLHNIMVRGEAINIKFQSSGHIYFSLLDKENILNIVIFRSYVTSSIRKLQEGDTVVVRGDISVYGPKGTYQLVARDIRPVGVGALLLQFEMLKKKLQGLGWFTPERKRALPTECRRIGVITSPTGAVIRDILCVLQRRTQGAFHLLLYPVRVQGENAAYEIAQAIIEMNRHKTSDVLIVCRGGGSHEDLAAFNSEIVAHACFESITPVISAVGHETDITLLDLVADVRAATPSAAAELVSYETQSLTVQLQTAHIAFQNRMKHIIRKKLDSIAVQQTQMKVSYAPKKLLEYSFQRFDDIETAIKRHIQRLFGHMRITTDTIALYIQAKSPQTLLQLAWKKYHEYSKQLDSSAVLLFSSKKVSLGSFTTTLMKTIYSLLQSKSCVFSENRMQKRLDELMKGQLIRIKSHLIMAERTLQSANPTRPLYKGYAIIFHANTPFTTQENEKSVDRKDRKVIRSIRDLQKGEKIHIQIADGTAIATIDTK